MIKSLFLKYCWKGIEISFLYFLNENIRDTKNSTFTVLKERINYAHFQKQNCLNFLINLTMERIVYEEGQLK